jgi:hypothetical protein
MSPATIVVTPMMISIVRADWLENNIT